jgi:hypothetical protein
MSHKGVVHGNCIELDSPLSLPEGTRVTVQVVADPPVRKGSPAAVLQLAGTLTDAEAEAIPHAARPLRQVDQEIWKQPS